MVTFFEGTFPPSSTEQQALVGQGLHIIEASRSHIDIPHSRTPLDEWSTRRRDL